jgi:hypothetical protein
MNLSQVGIFPAYSIHHLGLDPVIGQDHFVDRVFLPLVQFLFYFQVDLFQDIEQLRIVVRGQIIQILYHRLKENGKNSKVVVCAIMRKLVHLIFGILKSGKPFDENYTTNHA